MIHQSILHHVTLYIPTKEEGRERERESKIKRNRNIVESWRQRQKQTDLDTQQDNCVCVCERLACRFTSPTNYCTRTHSYMHALTLTHVYLQTSLHAHTEAHSHSSYKSCSTQSFNSPHHSVDTTDYKILESL